MPVPDIPQTEPAPLAALTPFEEGDFHGLSPACARDAQYNDRRLVTRRKLLALAKACVARARAEAKVLDLEPRTSLHHPHAFNGMQVKRLWTYLCRGKKEKARLKRTIGPDLAKDLDAAYRNAYLCVALEPDAMEVSLRIHTEAWYDGQNLKRRVEREGKEALLELLNQLPGYRLHLHDWKGEWTCGALTPEALDEFFRYYTPGDHGLRVEQRIPVPPAPPELRARAFAEDVPEYLVGEVLKLLPVYRWGAWSKESDFLLGG